MAQDKNEKFVNERKVDIELEGTGLKGSVTVPIIMSSNQLAQYVASTRANFDLSQKQQEEDYEGEALTREHSVWNNIHHLVLRVNFPGVSMANFKAGGKRPWPALIFQIQDIVRPTIDAALNVKKSES